MRNRWILVGLVLMCSKLWAGEVLLDDLLKKADLARSGSEEGMTWKVNLVSEDQGVHTESSFLVKTLADKALIEALSPARSKGEILLFQGRILWFFKPGLSRPVSLSSRQRLSGQAANGDVARTNYVRDYTPQLKGEETIDGKPCHTLQLEAKAKDTTYDKIKYWVSKDKAQGLKAQYQALDGTPLKNAKFTYGTKLKINGQDIEFIQEIRIEDANNPKNYSVMSFSAPKLEKHSESIFNVNNLRR